jgi:hypothetical protein
MSSGDDALDIKLGAVGCVSLRNGVGKFVCPEIKDKREGDVVVSVEILAVCISSVWDPVTPSTSLCLNRTDDGCDKNEDRLDRVDEDNPKKGWFEKYSVTSSSKSSGGICGHLNDRDDDHPPRGKPGRRKSRNSERLDVCRLGLPGRSRGTTEIWELSGPRLNGCPETASTVSSRSTKMELLS